MTKFRLLHASREAVLSPGILDICVLPLGGGGSSMEESLWVEGVASTTRGAGFGCILGVVKGVDWGKVVRVLRG